METMSGDVAFVRERSAAPVDAGRLSFIHTCNRSSVSGR